MTGTVEQIFGTAGIARINVAADGRWEVEYDGETDVIWDTETTVTEGPDSPFAGPHDDCTYLVQHRHPDAAFDQFMPRTARSWCARS